MRASVFGGRSQLRWARLCVYGYPGGNPHDYKKSNYISYNDLFSLLAAPLSIGIYFKSKRLHDFWFVFFFFFSYVDPSIDLGVMNSSKSFK